VKVSLLPMATWSACGIDEIAAVRLQGPERAGIVWPYTEISRQIPLMAFLGLGMQRPVRQKGKAAPSAGNHEMRWSSP
jgi:hypothetical protein